MRSSRVSAWLANSTFQLAISVAYSSFKAILLEPKSSASSFASCFALSSICFFLMVFSVLTSQSAKAESLKSSFSLSSLWYVTSSWARRLASIAWALIIYSIYFLFWFRF